MVFNQNYKKHFPTSLVCKLTNNSIRTKQNRKYNLRAKPYGSSFQKKEKHPLCRNTRRFGLGWFFTSNNYLFFL